MRKNQVKIISICVAAVLLLVTLLASFTFVPTGYTGVRKTFGQISEKPASSGFNWKIPFVQTIQKVNNKQQDIEIETEVWSEAADRTPVYAAGVIVTYSISPEHSSRLVATVDTKIKDLIDVSLVSSAIKSATRELSVDDVTNRAKIEPLTLEKLNLSLEQKYGKDAVVATKIVIKDMDFEEAYNKAIQEKSIAKQVNEKQAIENDTAIKKAEGNKKIAITNAEADKQVAITNAEAAAEAKRIAAEAEAEANAKVSASLTDKVLESKFYEKWNGNMPQVLGENAVITDISGKK